MKMLEDMQEEMRKMKAMIVKHEKRIRVLEANAGEGSKVGSDQPVPPLPGSEPPPSITVNNINSIPEEMAPDEV